MISKKDWCALGLEPEWHHYLHYLENDETICVVARKKMSPFAFNYMMTSCVLKPVRRFIVCSQFRDDVERAHRWPLGSFDNRKDAEAAAVTLRLLR